jgi:glyoxylase-like metal-dependent hydrolase (beta-lactamase superfamily II)
MKITEDIHLIKCPLQKIFTGVYAILGDRITLFDAGLPDSPESTIFPYFKSLGRDPSEISLVIASHGHDDHFGGIKAIKEKSNARVAAHAKDVAYIENPPKLWHDLHRRFPKYHPKPKEEEISIGKKIGVKVDIQLEDGMMLDLGPFRARVIHTPGHTDGSICLYDEKRKVLLTGDSVQGRGTILQSGPLVYGDLEDYLESINKLKLLDPNMMLLDHQYLPMESAILGRSEAREILEESIRYVESIVKIILDSINSNRMIETTHLVEKIKDTYGTATSMPPCSIVDAVLRSLEKRKQIRRFDNGKWVSSI